jgi:hypothetical protein
MKPFFYLLLFALTTSIANAQTFKISSFYYIDSAPKPNEIDSKIVFITDREVTCQGNITNKIFIDKNGKGSATTPYLLIGFWPSYFFKQAAVVNAEIDAFLGGYNPALDACQVGFNYAGGSTQRWYDPHVFKVSEEGDENLINKVYYQLYINTRNPSYAPWVYADTDLSVTCGGVTTNRVIPRTNPDEYGRIIPREYGSQVDLSYSSENTRSFFDLLSGKIDSYTVGGYVPELNGCEIFNVKFSENSSSAEAIQIGKQLCIDDPRECDLFSEEELDLALELGIQDGVNQCIDTPSVCGLFHQDELDLSYENGLYAGTQDCVTSPEGCGLFGQEDINASYENGLNAGVQDCITSPEGCGLFDQNAINTSLIQGVYVGEQNCKNNPESCDLFNKIDIDGALAEGVTSGKQGCKDDPETCELFDQVDIEESKIAGEIAAKAECLADPASCELYDLEMVNEFVGDGIELELEEIASLLPKGVIKSVCKKHPDSLLCVHAEDEHSNCEHNEHGKHKHDKHDKHDKHKHDKHDKHKHDKHKHKHDKHDKHDKHEHDKCDNEKHKHNDKYDHVHGKHKSGKDSYSKGKRSK